jgi:hypothetical protein
MILYQLTDAGFKVARNPYLPKTNRTKVLYEMAKHVSIDRDRLAALTNLTLGEVAAVLNGLQNEEPSLARKGG